MLGKYIGEMDISAFPQLSLIIFFKWCLSR